ncbi:MAG: cysteine--tRNA ligase [Bacteriovoracaceae bacterium]|nr:cysteine--tRNA ligase [Bacteriovoracaceae bacterium]
MSNQIFVYNTLVKKKVGIESLIPDQVNMYVCGPTVYNFAHIGNARPAIVFDILYRLLKYHFKKVTYLRNITDIDDKINLKAKEENVDISVISERYTKAYQEDMRSLGALNPDIEPRVTESIPEIINMVKKLLKNGSAYITEGHVLFHVPSFSEYGKLSGRNVDEMIAGARVEIAPFKRDPRDFVLWKPSDLDQPGWESPWGKGRPGWHIECSAMIEKYLGTSIDIHGGGQDLIFPHHENEIAQGTAAHDGELYCRTWIHNGFVTIEGKKMSKSLGNVLLVRDLLNIAPGEAIRWVLLSTHYRNVLDWNEDRLEDAILNLERIYIILDECSELSVVKGEIDPELTQLLKNDLNTSAALSYLRGMAEQLSLVKTSQLKANLIASANFLGFLQNNPKLFLMHLSSIRHRSVDIPTVEKMIELRNLARQNKDYKGSDEYRGRLLEMGIQIEDSPDGTKWRYSSRKILKAKRDD